MFERIKNIDRRWIFLMMLLAVAIPILLGTQFPEIPTGLSKSTFDEIESLPMKVADENRRPRVLLGARLGRGRR